ncbi:MAG: DUF423 domain-containing protein [Marinobacterium sp.]|nr:DUF423 domain-containing protein [Marinobacterium sp.]
MSSRWMLLIAAVYGFAAVVLGAFGAHALKTVLSGYSAQVYQTAVDYQFYHALALLAAGLLQLHLDHRGFRLAGFCFSLGVLLFSGSLYVLALSGIHWLGAVTPVGGLLMLSGWLCLGWGVFQSVRD